MTIQELRNARLLKYLKCEEAILHGQSYQLESRTWTLANLAEVRKAIEDLLAAGAYIDEEPPTPGRIRRVVFVD